MRVSIPLTLLLGLAFLFAPAHAETVNQVQEAAPAAAGLGLHEDGIQFPDGTFLTSAAGSYAAVVVVAKSGGHYSAIQAALDSITDASQSNPYLLWVAPGVYAETVTMKEWVDIQGSGEGVTTITSTDTTLLGADDAELRFLTVESTGGATATAIYNVSVSPRLTNVTATATGGTDNNGVYNYPLASPRMTNVTATATGGTYTHGVRNRDGSTPRMTNVIATGSGGSHSNYGVYNLTSSDPTMTDVIATATDGTYSYGVVNSNSDLHSGATMTNVTAKASGATNNYAVYNDDSSPTMTTVAATAEGGTYAFAVYNRESSPRMVNVTARAWWGTYNRAVGSFEASGTGSNPYIHHSLLEATGGTTNYAVYVDSLSSVKVAMSWVVGGIQGTPGNCICVGAYDGVMVPLDSNCQ